LVKQEAQVTIIQNPLLTIFWREGARKPHSIPGQSGARPSRGDLHIMMKGIGKIKDKMIRNKEMSNVKAKSPNEINSMTNVKNQIPCPPKAENLTFEIYAFI
jgi:hypothetical protein